VCHRASVSVFHKKLPPDLKERISDIPLLNFLSSAPPSFRITDAALLQSLSRKPAVVAHLDLLEEIVFHLVNANCWEQAWDIYHHLLGGYGGLALRLGDCIRGERLCRLLAGIRSADAFNLPDWIMGGSPLSVLLFDWGRFLKALGELRQASRLVAYLCDQKVKVGDIDFRPRAYCELADLEMQAGRLRAAAQVLKDKVLHKTMAWDPRSVADVSACLAFTNFLKGDTLAAAKDFEYALHWQHQHDHDQNPLYGYRGYLFARYLLMLGQQQEAEILIERAEEIGVRYGGPQNQDSPFFRLTKADLLLGRGDLQAAQDSCQQSRDCAVQRDAAGLLCMSSRLMAKMQIAQFGNQKSEFKRDELLAEAKKSIDEGLRIACDCGYGIYHIDLLLERAHLNLLRGEPQTALDDLRVALDDGVHPAPNSAFPTLLAATDPECGYEWGIAKGRHFRAQAFLLQAAQILGRPDFAPANFKGLPPGVRSLIESARKELEQCRELRKRIQDPKVRDTEQVLKELEGGVLILDWVTKDEHGNTKEATKESPVALEAHASERISRMKIPNSVIYVVGDVLGSWYYSHTKLNTLFGGNGFPGEPPLGNCIEKCQQWLRRANESTDVDPLELLGRVLVEFMNLDLNDDQRWQSGLKKITQVLLKNALAFGVNGIVPQASANSSMSTPPHRDFPETSAQEVIANPTDQALNSVAPHISTTKPMKTTILFLAANPDGVTKLALDTECRAIREKIRASDFPKALDFRTEWAVRPDDLLQYLNEYRPHVVHFSGHGSASEELVLHNETDQAKPVSKEALRSLFTTLRDNIRLVVLNACYSRAQAEAVVEVIDCAIGMKKAIGDQAAIVFAASFYRALGFGRSVKDAFDQGRTALLLEGIPEENTPDLLVKAGGDASRVFLAGPSANPK
jgi:tetratricopeptide (TPR) repeat protein